MKSLFFSIFLAGYICSGNLHALDACDVLNPQAKVSEKIEADVKGSASTLFKVGAIDGDVKVSLEKETINIYGKYKDANKTVIKGKLIYLYCRVIQDSESLNDLQKLNAIRKLYSENEELNIPDNSSNLQVNDEVEFTLKSCKQKSQSIKCKFTVKNTSSDKRVYINGNSFIIDSEGDEYRVSHIKFGKITKQSSPEKLLVKGVTVKAELVFNKVTSSGDAIPLIKFRINSKHLDYRNVALTN